MPRSIAGSGHSLRRSAPGLLVGDLQAALDWQALPEARRKHPTTEHFYPHYVALGAGGPGAVSSRLLRAVQMGGLELGAFSFG